MFASILGLALISVPGPDSVVVVANTNSAESVALAKTYQRARQLPRSHLCEVDVAEDNRISLEEFQSGFLDSLNTCLINGGLENRIEAFVLVKGLPLQVSMMADGRTRLVSLAAALMVAESSLNDGTPLLGEAPGRVQMCGGGPCYAAKWANPFTSVLFGPGWSKSSQGVNWKLRLVTMLNGRTYEDAAKLITSATTAEARPQAQGSFVFMDGGDTARSFLDSQYSGVMNELSERGFTDVQRVPYDQNLTGLNVASFLVGTLELGETIEGNQFAPGSLVDNLTSFGATPINFSMDDQSQVSIARWVAKGVGGVHGTTAEPLANSFPNRAFLLDYVDGMTLSQAYYRRMPFVYWQNLVLGDPMLAPYATRPVVRIDGLPESGVVKGSTPIRVSASDAMFRGIGSLKIYVNGNLLAQSQGEPIELCAAFPGLTEVEILVVAQVFGVGERYDQYLPKGWNSVVTQVQPGPDDCPEEVTDAGVVDSMVPKDAGQPSPIRIDAGLVSDSADSEGCTCRTSTVDGVGPMLFPFFWVCFFFLRRRSS